jgi:hypothetical protein
MRVRLIVAFVSLLVPLSSVAAQHWVDAKAKDAMGLGQYFVDRDSVKKMPDGRYGYRMRSVMELGEKSYVDLNDYRVDCRQDMSDNYNDVEISEKRLSGKSPPAWRDSTVTAGSGTGQVARYVCFTMAKLKPVKRAPLSAADKALCDAVKTSEPLTGLDGAHLTAACDSQGNQPLHLAVLYDQVANARLLLEAGAPVDGRAAKGGTPLMLAESTDMAELLLAHGASVSARDKHGETPLHEAGVYSLGNQSNPDGHRRVAELLIGHGADVNATDGSGDTPLATAAQSGRAALIQLLLDHGANPQAKDKNGNSAIDAARIAQKLGGLFADRPDAYTPATDFDAAIALLRAHGTPERAR